MRQLLATSILLIAILSLISCKDSSSPTSNTAWINTPNEGYVWYRYWTLSLQYTGDTPESVVFYVDNGTYSTDTEAPFTFEWDLEDFEYGPHRIEAKVYFPDDEIYDTDDISIRYMPMPFKPELLENYDGYTKRDEHGNLIGEVDSRDWQLWDLNTELTREATIGGVELRAEGRKVYIDWNTVFEDNHTGFYLYRATDPDAMNEDHAIQINQYAITGTPGDDGIVYYSWIDSLNIEYMTYYYWLDAVDQQGVSEVSGPWACTVSEDIEWITSISSPYPNPTTDESSCYFTLSEESEMTVMIVDRDGDILDIIMNAETLPAGANSFTWNCSDFSYGLYRCAYYIKNESNESIGYGDIVHGISN